MSANPAAPVNPAVAAPTAAQAAAAPAAVQSPTAQPAVSTTPGLQPDGFMAKMMAVFKEAMELELVKFRAELKTNMEQIVKEQQDQAVSLMKDGLGISKDPVIHLSEMPAMLRKILQENPAAVGLPGITKTSATAAPAGPVAGNPELIKTGTVDPAAAFKDLTAKRGAI